MDICSPSGVPTDSNMAAFATNSDHLISRLIPEHLKKDDDLEMFISNCNRYFKAAGVPDSLKETLVVTLLSRDLIAVYENTRPAEKGFENRLREAFQVKKSQIEVLREAVEFKRTTESTTEFFAKTRKMAEKIMSFQWTIEEIEKCLLLNCNNDEETRKEIMMRDIKGKEDIQQIIKKMDEVKSDRKQINAVKASYANITKWNHQPKDKKFSEKRTYGEQRTCWNCHEVGHISMQCQKQRDVTCFGCGRKGHIRRECRIRCTRCDKTGHYADDCFSKVRHETYFDTTRGGRLERDGERPRWWINSNRNSRLGKLSGRTSQSSSDFIRGKTNERQVAIMDRADEDVRSIRESEDYYRGIERGRQLAAEEERDREYERKNESRQVAEEPILAMA